MDPEARQMMRKVEGYLCWIRLAAWMAIIILLALGVALGMITVKKAHAEEIRVYDKNHNLEVFGKDFLKDFGKDFKKGSVKEWLRNG